MVLTAKHNVYHLSCFVCHQCNRRLNSGDRFILFNNRILCEYDFRQMNLIAFNDVSQNVCLPIKKKRIHHHFKLYNN
ncbi:hypothetical protein B4U80_08367 [Leptotrombidium deliense]|uniref:LIM zinc-binding domain-containing protein n=1 Tax=Leptotrombidium deliense TaxID=299467 RepID=A0A443SCB9_9ACAR|nr:hypothetical protein B4U80_08367 [Leptotrombidium deliense]